VSQCSARSHKPRLSGATPEPAMEAPPWMRLTSDSQNAPLGGPAACCAR
jgi:hypothetical protein